MGTLDDPNAALDAAARKKLPIWLRQGLEKMETEKQKKEQDQISAKLREEKLRKKRELELNRSPQRSKFDDMNSDTSDVEDNPAPQKVRKSRFDERREPVEEKSEPA